MHVADRTGKVVLQKKLRRAQVVAFFQAQPRALVGMEACGSAHYWAPTASIGPRGAADPGPVCEAVCQAQQERSRDAEAICEAVSRPNLRFVAIKTVDQQAARGLERARDLLTKQQTQMMNCVRSLLPELGIIAAQGRRVRSGDPNFASACPSGALPR